jgi:hypothetical protein
MPPLILPESPADRDAVRLVNLLAFRRDAEADLVAALRAGGFTRVSLVAEVGGRVVGHILFSDLPVVTAGGVVPALALAPHEQRRDRLHLGLTCPGGDAADASEGAERPDRRPGVRTGPPGPVAARGA